MKPHLDFPAFQDLDFRRVVAAGDFSFLDRLGILTNWQCEEEKESDMKWRLDGGQIEVLDEALADVLRRKTPAEKVQMIAAAHRTARQLIRAGVHHQHPDWDDARVEAEVLRRLTRGAD